MAGFLCLWIPHLSAWVLAQSEPNLKKHPFAVCERGHVVAASPAALQSGVTVGMTSARAQSALSSLLIVGRDRAREELAWNEIQLALYRLTPKVEPVTPGLLFADVEAVKVSPLVHHWGIQAGYASDRATAQLAALGVASGQVRTVKAGHEASFREHVSLCSLADAGIEAEAIQRLGWFGWKNMAQLRHLSRRQLEEQAGASGKAIYQLAQGPKLPDNLRRVSTWTPPEEVHVRLVFELPAREPNEWNGALAALLVDACSRLGSRSAQTFELTADTIKGPLCVRRVLKEPVNHPRQLAQVAEATMGSALQMLAPLPPVVSGLELSLGALSTPLQQSSLFEADKSERIERPKRLKRVLENIESRFPHGIGHFKPNQPHSVLHEELWAWRSALDEIKVARINGVR